MTQDFQTDKVNLTSADIVADRIAQLKELFPEAFTEGKVDFDQLRAALGDIVDDRQERYAFTWAGKADAIRALQAPTAATLVPCPDESVDWDTTHNLFIEGDNLEVLKLLYRPYFGQVKMIYIDPPYNTGKDFIYPDNFTDPIGTYLQLTGQADAEGTRLTSNAETSGRYHSAWLTMMYPRLFLARQLLREDGIIFVSIDDHEVHNLRLLMNEIFGEENFLASSIWEKVYSPRMDARAFSDDHDYIVVYRRSQSATVASLPFQQRKAQFTNVDPNTGRLYRRRSWRKEGSASRRIDRPHLFYTLHAPDDTSVLPIRPDGTEGRWRGSIPRFNELDAQGEIEWVKSNDAWHVYVKQFYDNQATQPPSTIWHHEDVGHNHEAVDEMKSLFDSSVFDNPKPTRLISRMLRLATDPHKNHYMLDFFAGSATAAQAVLQLNRQDGGNRRFIMVQLPEPTENPDYPTIADIGKERIRHVIARMKQEGEGQLDLDTRDAPDDLGFRAFKLAPSHFQPWTGTSDATLQDFVQQMGLFTDPLNGTWHPQDIITEIALKEGFSLSSRVQTAAVAGHTVYRVTDPDHDQAFHICLDDNVATDVVAKLNLSQDDLFVCRDTAIDDTTAANLALQCRLETI
jgi:adenine-specific DNA-methyltransferase